MSGNLNASQPGLILKREFNKVWTRNQEYVLQTAPKVLLNFSQFIYGFSWAVPVFYFYLSGATEVGDRVHRCTKERKKGKTKSRVPARSIPSSSPTATAKIKI